MSSDAAFHDISTWLENRGFGEYGEKFAQNHIELEDLAALTSDDLKEIGIGSLGHRKKLLAEIQKLATEIIAPSPEPESAEVPAKLPRVETPTAPSRGEAPAASPPIEAPAAAAPLTEIPVGPTPAAAASTPDRKVVVNLPPTPKSFPAVVVPEVATPKNSPAAKRAGFWAKLLTRKFLLISIGLHLLFGLGATYFIVQRVQAKRKVTFQGGPPSTNPSKRALEHKVSMAQKKKTGGAPPQAKRIVSAGLAKVTLPDLPSVPTATTVVPGMKAGMGGAGFGMGMGFGNGMGSGMGGGGGGGGGMTLFGFRGAGLGLIGTFYDLKQTRDRKPTNMGVRAGEGVEIHNAENNAYIETLKRFVSSWNPEVLSKFFRSETQLSTTQIFIPTISADEAPKAFGVEKECQGRRWIVHYKGEIIPPRTGRFRFVGICDDIIVVRCNMRNVFDGSLSFYRLDPQANESVPGLAIGKWFNARAGDPLKMEVIVGECPGGNFTSYLMIEEEGAPKPPESCPVFQLRQMPVPKSNQVNPQGSIVFTSKAPINPFQNRAPANPFLNPPPK